MFALLNRGEPNGALSILELFHRKAPQALDMPGGEEGTTSGAP